MTRLAALCCGALAIVWVLASTGAAFAADGPVVKLPNGDGPHCAANGQGSRVFVSVRTKEDLDPATIHAVSDVWVQTNVVGARNSWVVRLKGPRPVAATQVQIVTSGGSATVDVPGFDAPCPVKATGAATGTGATALDDAFTAVEVLPATATGSAATATTKVSGTLPYTGLDAIQLLRIGAISLGLGMLLLLGPRRRHRPEPLHYDGRFL